ncbi:unnamed protein product [Caenorhabditis sp. 36 PRJEB53466]|nr:unnamed protein product [Caenorhabditis sp. 36 PRJEB53466]
MLLNCLFICSWILLLLGLFILARELVFQGTKNEKLALFGAFLATMIVLFEAILILEEHKWRDDTLGNRFQRWMFGESQSDHWKWHVNPITVPFSLCGRIVVLTASVFGESCGKLVGNFFAALPVPTALLMIPFPFLCISLGILCVFGYQFNIGYGLIKIDPGTRIRSMLGRNTMEHGPKTPPKMVTKLDYCCANCYNFLRRLNDIATQRNHRIIVVAPDFESNHIIQRTSSAFPNLQIDRAGEGWPRLGATNFDAIVLDACGRVAETLGWPQTDVTTSTTLLLALDSAHSKCAPCSNQNQNQSPRSSSKKINAYIKEQQEQRSRDYGRSRSASLHNYPPQPPNQQYRQQQQQQPAQNANPNPNPISYYPQQQQPAQNLQYHYQNQAYPQQNPNGYFYTPPPPIPTKIATTTTTTTSNPADYDYYPNDGTADEVVTTQSPQTQIPRPPSSSSQFSSPNWPTFPPYLHQNPYSQQSSPQLSKHHLPAQFQPNPIMENNLPCSAFTDDICYQQRERMGSLMSKCCNKGVYLTDVCVPGKCSNSTTQLCCFQKFLQAKYSCCGDASQDDGAPKMTNQFNKCCHNLFVTDDPCCPAEAAKRYWATTYEVCMPTVTVDFSPVRFEVHFTEGVRVLDLNVDRQWEFNCTYGQLRPQFAYLP